MIIIKKAMNNMHFIGNETNTGIPRLTSNSFTK